MTGTNESEAVAALVEALRTRAGEPLLVELTNPGQPGADAVNEARLTAACGDARAQLEAQTGVAYVAESAVQVMLAVELALALLYERAGAPDTAARYRTAVAGGLRALAERAARLPRASAPRAFDFDARTWHGYRPE